MTTRVTGPTDEETIEANRRLRAISTYRFGTRLHYLVQGEPRSLCGRERGQMVPHFKPHAPSSCRVCTAAAEKLAWMAADV